MIEVLSKLLFPLSFSPPSSIHGFAFPRSSEVKGNSGMKLLAGDKNPQLGGGRVDRVIRITQDQNDCQAPTLLNEPPYILPTSPLLQTRISS